MLAPPVHPADRHLVRSSYVGTRRNLLHRWSLIYRLSTRPRTDLLRNQAIPDVCGLRRASTYLLAPASVPGTLFLALTPREKRRSMNQHAPRPMCVRSACRSSQGCDRAHGSRVFAATATSLLRVQHENPLRNRAIALGNTVTRRISALPWQPRSTMQNPSVIEHAAAAGGSPVAKRHAGISIAGPQAEFAERTYR